MTNKNVFTIDIRKIPKNGRINKYLKELLPIWKQGDAVRLQQFMLKIYKYCKNYLKKVLQVNFPAIKVCIIGNEEEYAELWKKYDETLGTKPYRKAFCIIYGVSPFYKATIYINFQRHFKGKTPMGFIINLSVSFLEELVHSTRPYKSEVEVHELVCSVVDGFLETKLPDKIRQEKLRRDKIWNGISGE